MANQTASFDLIKQTKRFSYNHVSILKMLTYPMHKNMGNQDLPKASYVITLKISINGELDLILEQEWQARGNPEFDIELLGVYLDSEFLIADQENIEEFRSCEQEEPEILKLKIDISYKTKKGAN